jgi:pantetheine-phosphate adenylyltransferase
MPHRTQHIVAVYPGSFDPITHGHLDVIRRASQLFNTLIIGVGQNPEKQELFPQVERLRLIQPHLLNLPNVKLGTYAGLTIDFVRQCGGRVVIRGIRDVHDLSSELQQANVNMALGGIETVFLLTSDQHAMTSSTYVKQIFELGGGDPDRVKRLVPANVAHALAKKLCRPRQAARRRSRVVSR